MQRNLQRTGTLCNPRVTRNACDIFDKNDCLPSIDTWILFSARWPKGTLAKVNELQRGLQPAWFDRCENEDGYCWGLTLTVQQPRRETLLFLGRNQNRYKIKVSRIDVVYDFISQDEESKRIKTAWLRGHVLLLHRRAAFLEVQEKTVSWIQQVGRRRQSSKDVVLYDDRHCKLDGQADCTHLEIKLYDARTIQGLGLDNIGELVDLDPHELFARTIKLTAFDVEEYVNRCIKKSFKGHLMDKTKSKFAERWNANLHRRLKGIMDRKFQHSAQRAKDILGHKRVNRDTISTDELQIPHALSFPLSSKSRSGSPSNRPRNGSLKSFTVISKRGRGVCLTCKGRAQVRIRPMMRTV